MSGTDDIGDVIALTFILPDPAEGAELETLDKGSRDRLIARTLIVCTLRPGELFALCWRNVQQGRLKSEEALEKLCIVQHEKLGWGGTPRSSGVVCL